jgi:L-seryl-tRNA(Ser) seleniumtransferase
VSDDDAKGAAKGAAGKKPRGAKSAAGKAALRDLAAVDEVLREPALADVLADHPRDVVVAAVRTIIERLRDEILAGDRKVKAADLSAAALAPWVRRLVELAVTPSLRPVINATGVVAHTNLGRSLLPDEAIAAVGVAAGSYSDLEYDLAGGERASRQDHVHDVLCTLTGAGDALVVNNNAAAVLLALAATARGGDVLVSRGQLVEIGDGFRIPDILVESGAGLVEVGTTNRTHLRDYERAWTERTRAILRVHTSNYRIVGFTAEPAVGELVELAHARGAVVIDDLGSGALGSLDLFADEPRVGESLAAGVDVVTFSGDKLLGGPQAGIAVGAGETVATMRRHPLARAVRIDKLNLAALDALLRLYLDPDRATAAIPTLAMLAAPLDEVQARAARIREALAGARAGVETEIVASVARAGAGALPVTEVQSAALAVVPADGDADGLARRLRSGTPAVVARVHEGRLLIDARSVRDAEVETLVGALAAALG